MQPPGTIRVGMSVQSADGEQLGTVVAVSEGEFRIARGLFFQKEYLALSEDVLNLAADTVTLRQTAEELTASREGAGAREISPGEVSPDHVSEVLRAATSPHDLAEEEDARRREAVRTVPSSDPEPTHA